MLFLLSDSGNLHPHLHSMGPRLLLGGARHSLKFIHELGACPAGVYEYAYVATRWPPRLSQPKSWFETFSLALHWIS